MDRLLPAEARLIKEIAADMRQALIKNFVAQKVIPADLGRKFTQALE